MLFLFFLSFLNVRRKRERQKREEAKARRSGFLRSVFFFFFFFRRLSASHFTPEILPSLPRGPLLKLRHGFYPPRHASRRSVLSAAASIWGMQGAPWRPERRRAIEFRGSFEALLLFVSSLSSLAATLARQGRFLLLQSPHNRPRGALLSIPHLSAPRVPPSGRLPLITGDATGAMRSNEDF